MHVCPPPKTFLRLDVVGPDGEPLERYEDRAHSWVRNAYNLQALYSLFAQSLTTGAYEAGSLRCKLMSGTVGNNYGYNITNLVSVGTSANDTAGILVGSSNNAESFESFALGAKIANGNGAGQLSYQIQPYVAPIYDSVTKKWTSSPVRIFNNNSGASIDVNEVAMLAMGPPTQIMVCRDVLATTITVPNAGQLTVTYTIEMTFPA